MADPSGGAAADCTTEQPPPPPTQRRPRVREVSSRFMSPLIQSNSTPIPTSNHSDFPRSKSSHHRQPSKTDENHVPETNRSLDKSAASIVSTVQRKQHQQRVKQHSKENGEPKEHQHSSARVLSRPDTPISMCTDRIVPSRYRQVPNSVYRSNSLNSSSNGCGAVTAATRLLQEATSDVDKKLSRISTSSHDDFDACSTTSNHSTSSCPNSPLCVPSNKARSVPDIRTSMPDVEKWLAERNSGNAFKSTSDCARSLNFSSSGKMGGGVSLPPHPSSCVRSGLDMKKGKKLNNHQEDVHSLKLLSNHYLQWRFANAKAEASIHSQKQETERKVYSLGRKISEICDNVERKRNELAVLRGIKKLTTIVEAQMPYLDEWTTLEDDYSTSLSDTTNALLSSAARLPISGEVRVDAGELKEALGSALKVVELIGSHIQRFMHKAEEMDISVSELARLAGGGSAFIEECGDLLSKAYISQVKECSLRGTLVQICNSNQQQTKKRKDKLIEKN
ncbi:hypothetical protein CDL12_07270 [Handroanthus impetiginosus]|uniref:Uncharacterized protein n=1 Tax=Handroanthus impetiginosus TaxID=429701 RepID=A0A2G9HRA3_9LAMI|nr:hypothetical protein CDL12_07270 [Handroanthus impetiginosus]